MPQGIPSGFGQSQNRAYTRTPQRSATAEGRLTDMLRGDNAYLTGSRDRGRTMAQKQGFANLTAAANASEQAGIQAAAPIAAQDANTFAQAEGQNQDALNAFEAQKLKAETDEQALQAAITQGAGAVYHGAQLNAQNQEREYAFQREMAEAERQWRTGERLGTQDYSSQDREDNQGFQSSETAAERAFRLGERLGTQEWESGENRANRSWQSEEAGLNRNFEAWSQNFNANTAANMSVLQTILSDPTYFRDPAAVNGMMSFFANLFPSLSTQYLRPGG